MVLRRLHSSKPRGISATRMPKHSESEDEGARGSAAQQTYPMGLSPSPSPGGRGDWTLVLVRPAALLTQKTLELLCQLFTADRLFGLSGRTLGALGRPASLTLQVFDVGRNLGVFGNRFSYTCVKLTCFFLHLRQKRRQAHNLQTTAHDGENALGVGLRRNIVRHVGPDAC